jgi:hypothetical protein
VKGDGFSTEEMSISDKNYSISVPMARVAEIAQNATAHWANFLTSTVTSDDQLS